jgi:O-antigen ligase
MNKKIWSKIIVYSSLAACIHLAYSYLSFDILRFHGTSGHPITYANMVVTIMLLLLLGMKDYGSSKKILLLIILLTLGLLTAWVLTQTRGPVIGFLISLALIIFWLRNKNIFLFSILSLGVLFYFQNSLSERLTKLADLDINILDKTTIEKVLRSHSSKYVPLRERGTYFFYGFSTINKYPYTGIGPQNIEDDMKGYIKETGYLAVSRDHLHNDYIDISAKFGLPSLLLLLIIYYCMFVNVNNENRQLFIIFMIMLLTSQLSQSQFAHNQAIVFFIASLFVLKSTNKSNI